MPGWLVVLQALCLEADGEAAFAQLIRRSILCAVWFRYYSGRRVCMNRHCSSGNVADRRVSAYAM